MLLRPFSAPTVGRGPTNFGRRRGISPSLSNYALLFVSKGEFSIEITVPAALLLDRELIPSAKLVWMLCRMYSGASPPPASRLAAQSGLTPATVRATLAQVAAPIRLRSMTTAVGLPDRHHIETFPRVPNGRLKLTPARRSAAPLAPPDSWGHYKAGEPCRH
jgi:hypothetical protein